MTGDLSPSKIDEKKYPIVSNIKNRLTQSKKDLQTKKFDNIISNYESNINLCEKLRKIAIRKNDEYCANVSFVFKVNISLIKNFAQFWKLCEEYEYPIAWSSLQDSIDNCETLLKFTDEETSKSFIEIHEYLSLIEKFFPYRIFCSSAIDDIELKCSICGKSPFDPECSHITGKLYWGEFAHNIVTNLKSINHIALVPNPRDKRCIIKIEYDKKFPEKSPFKKVYTFIKLSKRPFRNLEVKKSEKEVPRSKFDNEHEGWPCPCGSGMTFKECCYDKDIIKIPHYDIFFDND